MTHRMRVAIATAALSLAGAGCASVEWTEELFAKRQVEVDERFVKVETGVREQGERIDRVEVRVASLDTRLTETQDLIQDTVVQAPTTVAIRSNAPEGRAPRPAPERVPRAVRTLMAVIHVPFAFDRADLGPGGEAALAAILKELRANPTLTIDLEGSTDSVGGLDYNVRLSQRRVDAVKSWLVAHGVERARIVGATGRGPLANPTMKDEVKRRVMVKLLTSAE
jgi:outer membrane protein OmpA-like peptidoglycan-associated protein